MNTHTKCEKYGKPAIGCYLDQGHRSSLDHDIETVELAFSLGYESKEASDAIALLGAEEEDLSAEEMEGRENVAENMSEIADEAIEWLNEQEAREFVYWGNNGEAGAFGCWVNLEGAREEVEFISSRKADEPPAGYVGLWLSVSDHGNATLYNRDEGGADMEIWSIV